MIGLVGHIGAVAVAVPALLLGVWLVAGTSVRPPSTPDLGRARGRLTAGWVLTLSSAALMVLAVPITPGTSSTTPAPRAGGGAPGPTATPAWSAGLRPGPGGPG